MARGGREAFAAAGLTDVFGLFGDGVRGDVAAVAVGVGAGDGFLVELGEEDVGDGVMDGFGCGLEKVGEADVQTAFAQADGGVERGEAAEADIECGDGSAGAEFAVLVLEDGDEGRWCGNLFCAGLFRFGWVELCCLVVVKENRRWCRRRRKELQELAQGGGAGMLRCGQGLVLVAALMSLLDQTLFFRFHQLLSLRTGSTCWFGVGRIATSSCDFEVGIRFEAQLDRVEARVR
jgi:hypothetical protein